MYNPTHFVKLGKTYFIADASHHRILFSYELTSDLEKWKVLDDPAPGVHSIATDGKIFVADITGLNRLRVYEKDSEGKQFKMTQEIDSVGVKPHRVIYDQDSEVFMVITAADQQLFIYKNKDGLLKEVYSSYLQELLG